MKMTKLVTGCYAALLVLSAALPAAASQAAPPRYQSSDPSDGATVHEPPDRVEATFDQPLDGSSRLVVRDACDRRVDDGTTEVEGNTMSTGLAKKPSGQYHVEYVAVGLGGVTGTGSGHFTFTAHGGEACDGGKGKHKHDPKKNGNKKNHNDHRKNEHKKKGHDENEHNDGEHEEAGHPGGDDHSSMGTTSHDDHNGNRGDEGGHGDHKAEEGTGDDRDVASGNVPGITSGNDTSRKLLTRADSQTLLLSLGLCLALGILGGSILRASGVR